LTELTLLLKFLSLNDHLLPQLQYSLQLTAFALTSLSLLSIYSLSLSLYQSSSPLGFFSQFISSRSSPSLLSSPSSSTISGVRAQKQHARPSFFLTFGAAEIAPVRKNWESIPQIERLVVAWGLIQPLIEE
jgi:hypothetical protein